MTVMINRAQRILQLLVLGFMCVTMLLACGRTRPIQPPPGADGLPPVTQDNSSPRELLPQTLQTRNISRIHKRLFEEAQKYFYQRDFTKAIRELRRLLALNPKADLERDGHWWLGQAYDEVKDWESAQREYSFLGSAPHGEYYQAHSSRRLKEIQAILKELKSPPSDTQAIRFALNQLPGAEGFEQGIKKMRQDGVTTLLIDLGCQRAQLKPLSSKSGNLPDIEQLQGLLRLYTERTHRVGLLLYVGVNLRCVGNWAPTQHQGWRDRSYQVNTGRLSITKQFDLFHPAYQEFLARFLARLCKEEVDGVVFLNDYPLGLFEGITQIGLKRFEKQFGQPFRPSKVFYPGFDPLGEGGRNAEVSRSKAAVFWRWAGWKAHERLMIFESLVNRLRSEYPTIHFGLELHPHGLTDPVEALVTYAEDAMDAASRSFSFFFVRPEIDRRSAFTEQTVIAKLRRISTKAVLDRLLPVVDDPRRVWVSMPATSGQRLRSQTLGSEASPLQAFPSGIGIVHDLRAFS